MKGVRPVRAANARRRDIARDLLADLRRLDRQVKDNEAEMSDALAVTPTRLTSPPRLGTVLGKHRAEARRALKRRLCNVVYRIMKRVQRTHRPHAADTQRRYEVVSTRPAACVVTPRRADKSPSGQSRRQPELDSDQLDSDPLVASRRTSSLSELDVVITRGEPPAPCLRDVAVPPRRGSASVTWRRTDGGHPRAPGGSGQPGGRFGLRWVRRQWLPKGSRNAASIP